MASYSFYELNEKRQTKKEILKAAAKLVKADIRELQQSKIRIHLPMKSTMMVLLRVGFQKVLTPFSVSFRLNSSEKASVKYIYI